MEIMIEQKVNLADFGYNILQIETIAKCNMACTFCHYPFKEDKFSEMPTELVYRLMDEVDPKSRNFRYICFNQLNEPLMDKRIFDFIKYAKNNGFKTLIITNGLLLGKENIVQNLIEARPDFIKLSIQGVDKAKIKKIRGINLDIEKYFENVYVFLSKARQAKMNVTVDVGCNFYKPGEYWLKKLFGLTVGDPSVPNNLEGVYPNLIKFLDGLKAADPVFSADLRDFVNTEKNYLAQKPFQLSETIVLKVKQFWYGHKLSQYYPAQQKFSCGTSILSVLADGNVVPCCIAYDKHLALGNTKKNTLENVLVQNKEFFDNLRAYSNNGKHEMCKKCFGQPTKRGVWLKTLITNTKDIFSKKKVYKPDLTGGLEI